MNIDQLRKGGEMMNQEQVLAGYLECALWSTHHQDTGVPLDQDYGTEHLHPDTLAASVKACREFVAANEADLLLASEVSPYRAGYTFDEMVGHDLWLTRNGHGAGFWDRGYGAAGDRLTKACEALGSADLYVGDDGRLYLDAEGSPYQGDVNS